ncbi:MAG: mercury methylation corrinoid protein HgcA [Bacteroidota bacterium]
MKKQFIIDWIDTEAGKIPKVSTTLNKADKWNDLKVRLAHNRNDYQVEPGIYAVGNPDTDSIVLVSANYKLSFDVLRKELNGLDAWILVLDTKGINVWCAAGKGTFGTNELVNRIKTTQLDKIVNHKKVIVPQLGATGVAAHTVKKLSKFSVIYGPVRASDIRPFLKANMHATPEMRQVRFSFYDRLILVPVEVIVSFKYLVLFIAVFFILGGLNNNGYSIDIIFDEGIHSIINLVFAYMAGAILGPILLPWLPARSFSLKGFYTGIILFVISYLCGYTGNNLFEIIAWLSLIASISSFLTMNFTGASTYTSPSGVKKEMRIAVPLQIAASVIGIAFWITGRFV